MPTYGPWSNISSARTRPAVAVGVLADMADSFIDSMAMNYHPNFFSGPWSVANQGPWMQFVRDLGIRHYRTAYAANTVSRINSLSTGDGTYSIKHQLLINNQNYDTDSTATITSGIDALLDVAENQIGVSRIGSFEGLNEFNRQTFLSLTTGQRQSLCDKAIAFAQIMHDRIRLRAAFSAIPILGPSIWGRQNAAIDMVVSRNGGLGWAPYCDIQPLHNYTGGRKPTIGGVPLGEQGGTADYSLAQSLADHGTLVGGDGIAGHAIPKPIWTTEEGWYMVNAPGQTPTQALDALHVSSLVNSKYTSRMFLEHYLYGIGKTFVYSLLNNPIGVPPQPPNANRYFGCWSNDTDNATGVAFYERPVVNTIKRLVSIMKDPGVAFTPGRLNFTWTGSGLGTDFHYKLFQKRNGQWLIVCTLDAASHLRSSPYGDISVTPASVVLHTPAMTTVRTWKPHSSALATTVSHTGTLSLSVPDELMIIEMTP